MVDITNLTNATVAQVAPFTIPYDILMWVFAVAFGASIIAFVWVLMAYYVPAKKTFARFFIKAAKEKKHVSLKWCGNFWKAFICDDKMEPAGYWLTETGKTDICTPNSIGMSMGNVKLAVGEFENMKQWNVAVADVITLIAKYGVTPEEMRDVVFAIDNMKYEIANKLIKEKKAAVGMVDSNETPAVESKDGGVVNVQQETENQQIRRGEPKRGRGRPRRQYATTSD